MWHSWLYIPRAPQVGPNMPKSQFLKNPLFFHRCEENTKCIKPSTKLWNSWLLNQQGFRLQGGPIWSYIKNVFNCGKSLSLLQYMWPSIYRRHFHVFLSKQKCCRYTHILQWKYQTMTNMYKVQISLHVNTMWDQLYS